MNIFQKVTKYTALFEPEINFLTSAVKSAPKGNIVVAGTYKGGDVMSMMIQNPSREYHVIDSFQGLAPPVEQDIVHIGNDRKTTMVEGEFSCGGYEKYLENFKEAQMTPPKIYPMFITSEKLKEVKPSKVAMLWLDLDHYAPTKACLEYFDKFLVNEAIIACHDYGFIRCPGVKHACDSYSDKWRHAAGGIFSMVK